MVADYVFPLSPYLIAAFFVFALAVRRFTPSGRRWKIILAASVSYLLIHDSGYAVTLLAALTGFWLASRWMDRESGARKKRILAAALALAIGVLVFYKFSPWFLAGTAPLAVPLGMSYYVFRLIHYLVERYRGAVPARGLASFIHYLIFFPTVNAGPIERSERFVEAADDGPAEFLEGARRVVFGLFKSMAVAALLSRWCRPLLESAEDQSAGILLLAIYALAFYIYYDFAGYSDIAIGAGRLLGYRIMENFDRPYLSPDPAVFWRRWHISLSYFLRDYVYIPLGGSRRGLTRHYLNYMAVMIVCGLWHGGDAHFAAWGAWHGIGLVGNHAWKRALSRLMPGSEGAWWRKAAGVAVTFHFVAFGWLLFFFEVDQCLVIMSRLAGGGN